MLGFGVALGVGGGLGFGVGPFAEGLAGHDQRAPGTLVVTDPRVRVLAVEGEAFVEGFDGQRRPLLAGDAFPRPAALRVAPGGRVAFGFKGMTFEASHGAELLLSAPGPAIAVQLTRGRMLVAGTGRPVRTLVPQEAVSLSGTAYGVWVGEQVQAAVLDGTLELVHQHQAPLELGAGRQAIIGKRVSSGLLEPILEIAVEKVERRGRGSLLTGRTAPNASVYQLAGSGWTRLPVSPTGLFVAELAAEAPGPGELIAYDAAGRQAEVGAPSLALRDVLERLGAAQGERPAEVAAEVAEEASEEGPVGATPEDEDAEIRSLGGGAPKTAPRPPRAPRAAPEGERLAPDRGPAAEPNKPEARGERGRPGQAPPAAGPADSASAGGLGRGDRTPAPMKVELGGSSFNPPTSSAIEAGKPEIRLPKPTTPADEPEEPARDTGAISPGRRAR